MSTDLDAKDALLQQCGELVGELEWGITAGPGHCPFCDRPGSHDHPGEHETGCEMAALLRKLEAFNG